MVAFFIKYVQQHAAFLSVECALTDSVKCLGQRLLDVLVMQRIFLSICILYMVINTI